MDVEESCDSRVLDMPCLLYISTHWKHGYLHKIYARSSQSTFQISWGKGEALGCWWLLKKGETLSFRGMASCRLPTAQWTVPHPCTYGQHWLYSGLLIGKRKEKEWRDGSVVKSTFEMTQILFPAHTSGSSQSFIIPALGDLTPHPTPL